MAQPKPNPFAWFVHGPLGPWGRKLGFRWVFPVGTMPVPYHPLIPILLLATPLIWLVATLAGVLSGASGGGQWPWMLLAGLLLAIPLSIPIVNWAFRAFGAVLAQGLLFLSAMIALVADVATGRAAPAWAVLPAGYVLLYAAQRAAGLLRVRRYRRILAAFEPICADDRTVVLPSDKPFMGIEALRKGLARRVFVEAPSYGPAQLIEPIDPADIAALDALRERSRPRGWRIDPAGERFTLMRLADAPAGPQLRVGVERFGRRLDFRPGLVRWTLSDDEQTRELVSGTARIVGPWPLATLFYWLSITDGRGVWFAGFAPRDVRVTEGEAEDPSLVLAPLAEMPERSEEQRAALVAEARAAFKANEARERTDAAERAEKVRQWQEAGNPTRFTNRHGVAEVTGGADPARFWREVAADPSRWKADRTTYLVLCANAAECDREDLRRALNWLEAAIQVRARDAIVAAAKLLAAMDQALLASDYARIRGLLNSRIVGMVWRITPGFDVKPLPPKVPKFGDEAGFGLIRSVPELYLKLADLGPEMEDMIVLLVEEALRYDVSLPPELAAMARRPAATG